LIEVVVEISALNSSKKVNNQVSTDWSFKKLHRIKKYNGAPTSKGASAFSVDYKEFLVNQIP